MKIIIFLFMTYMLNADILQVKQLFNFKTVTVVKKVVATDKTYYGKTVVDESRVYDISLRFDAFVTKLYADKTYMKVTKGLPLFHLYSKEVVSLTEELVLSRKLSSDAAKNARRKLRLLGLDNLTGIKNAIEEFDYLSPADGYLIAKDINTGSFAQKGKTVLQIADFSTLWVIADVYQKDIVNIHKGMDVTIKVEGYPIQRGKVAFIYPKVNPKTQTIPVRIVLQNNKRLFPELFAKVKIEQNATEVLMLPKTALLQKGEKQYVFVPEGEGFFIPKEVRTKRMNSRYFAVVEGLSEGDKVVDKALFLLDSDALTNGLYDNNDEDEDW